MDCEAFFLSPENPAVRIGGVRPTHYQMQNQGDEEAHKENEKQNLGNSHGTCNGNCRQSRRAFRR